MRHTHPTNESGQANILEAVLVIVALFMLALPLFEYGRMAHDGILAASAAEDAAKAVAADTSLTSSDLSAQLAAHYPAISSVSSVRLDKSALQQVSYTHYLNTEDNGHVGRRSKVSYRDIEVTITVRRDFVFAVEGLLGPSASAGYEITKSATSYTDHTISSGAW